MSDFAEILWEAVVAEAEAAGLDAGKFGEEHRRVAGRIAGFLEDKPAVLSKEKVMGKRRWFWQRGPVASSGLADVGAVVPLVIVGEPGTGKTTFLYLIDYLLRTKFGLSDGIEANMVKGDRELSVPKRVFRGRVLSLLSVRMWARVLHFYNWDTVRHRFDDEALEEFIEGVLGPMRVIFADEVEVVGYAPTIPELARRGLLVVGTSNQYDFPQLEWEGVEPEVVVFGGEDMRLGSPMDAVVVEGEGVSQWFCKVADEPERELQRVFYRRLRVGDTVLMGFDFGHVVSAPLLENEWNAFLQATYSQAVGHLPLVAGARFVLLFDDFSLDLLAKDVNKIMRFVSLFDAVEQWGMGVLVRGTAAGSVTGVDLSAEAIEGMMDVVRASRDLSAEVKERALVGVGRMVSRLGVAGVRARLILNFE